MNLREFVEMTMKENNINEDIDKVIEAITNEAQKRAVDNCVAISDEDVREMILNAHELIANNETKDDSKDEGETKTIAKPKQQKAKVTPQKVNKPVVKPTSEQISLEGLDI